ncbi:MAG: flagellar filament capping protein FliD [Bacillota bacterium]
MSNLRIGGLSSGLDTDQIIEDLMKARRMRVDSLKQKKQQSEWQREDLRTINNTLRALRDTAFNMKLQGAYQAKKAASSNEAAVTASAGALAAAGSYIVTVTQLAQGVSKGSQDSLAEESNADGTVKTLKEQFSLPDSITFTLEGKMKADGSGTRYSQSFTIDTTTATINTLVSEINKHSGTLGITASYDSGNNRFFLATNGTGPDYGIKAAADPDGLLSDAGGDGSGKLKLLLQTGTLYQGQNAQFSIGDTPAMTSATNNVTVNGITLTLKQGGGATSTITVTRDTDAVYNSIKSFIDQYNSAIDTINKELSEERYKDYLPLTDDQREQLSDEQEKAWEEKARSGMLRNDSYLAGVVGKMRSAVGGKVSGITPVTIDGKSVTHNSLASIGIITGQYTEGGKLYLKNDGADLKKAIQDDPEGVMKLFANVSATYEEQGIARRLYDVAANAVNGVIDRAGVESTYTLYDKSVLGKRLADYDKRIKDMENSLVKTEDRYYRQFTALEKAISRMNAQSAWLAQQFNPGSR